MPVSSPPFPLYSRSKIGSTANFVLPGADSTFQANGTQTLSGNTLRYCPFYNPFLVTINNFVCEVATAGAAAATSFII